MDGVRESCASVYFIWGISSGFPLANHLILPGSESVFGIPQDSPLLAKVDSSAEACGKLDTIYYGVTPSPFLAPQELFCAWMAGKVSLTSRVEKYVFSLSFIWAPLCPCYFVYLGVSAHRGFPGSSVAKNLPANTGDGGMWVEFLGCEDPLE